MSAPSDSGIRIVINDGPPKPFDNQQWRRMVRDRVSMENAGCLYADLPAHAALDTAKALAAIVLGHLSFAAAHAGAARAKMVFHNRFGEAWVMHGDDASGIGRLGP